MKERLENLCYGSEAQGRQGHVVLWNPHEGEPFFLPHGRDPAYYIAKGFVIHPDNLSDKAKALWEKYQETHPGEVMYPNPKTKPKQLAPRLRPRGVPDTTSVERDQSPMQPRVQGQPANREPKSEAARDAEIEKAYEELQARKAAAKKADAKPPKPKAAAKA